jgi:hypothetical protein
MKLKKYKYVLFVMAIVTLCFGCDAIFKRPTPNKSDYLKKVLPEIPKKDIKSIDYIYHGAVGGNISIARVELQNKNQLAPILKIPLKKTYSFIAHGRQIEIDCIKSKFISGVGEINAKLPPWFDMDFSNPIEERTILKGEEVRNFYVNPNSAVFYLIAGGE